MDWSFILKNSKKTPPTAHSCFQWFNYIIQNHGKMSIVLCAHWVCIVLCAHWVCKLPFLVFSIFSLRNVEKSLIMKLRLSM